MFAGSILPENVPERAEFQSRTIVMGFLAQVFNVKEKRDMQLFFERENGTCNYFREDAICLLLSQKGTAQAGAAACARLRRAGPDNVRAQIAMIFSLDQRAGSGQFQISIM